MQGANLMDALVIESIQLNSASNEESLCRSIFNAPTGTVPMTTYLMDISQNSSIGKHLARKMGIASLRSTNFAKSFRDKTGWRNLNQIEKNYLISVLSPEAVIMHMVKDISNQFGYKSIVLIYDSSMSKLVREIAFPSVQV